MLKVTVGRTPGATSGGTLVTTRNHATGAVETSGAATIQLTTVDEWVPFELSWGVTGYRTSQAVVLPATTDIEWSANGVTGAGANTSLNVGVIGNAAVRVWVRAKTTRALGNLTQTVSNVVYGYGVEAPAAPVFTQAPAVVSVDQTSGIFTFAASDPNTGGSIASAKYQIVARGAALGSWASAASATSPQAFSGLTAETDYDLVVQITDDTGLTTTSSRYQFRTAAAASVAPSFTSQPALKTGSQTSQGFTVTYAVANPGGFALTHKVSIDGGSTYSTIAEGAQGAAGYRYFNSSTQLWEYTVAGLVSGSKSVKVQVLGDVYTVDSNTVSIATGTLSLTGTLTLTAGTTQLAADWPDATGGANGYDVEYGTTLSYGSAVSPDPTISAATITGLTGDVLHYVRVRAHDSAGNVTGWLTGSATPLNATGLFTNDFAAGQALNTAYVGTYAAGNGTATVASNKLTLSSAAASDGAIWAIKAALDKARSAGNVFKCKFAQTTLAAGAGPIPVIVLQHAPAEINGISTAGPSIVGGGTTTSRVTLQVHDDGDFSLLRRNSAGTWQYWSWTGGTWQTSEVRLAGTLGTVYHAHIETRLNGSTPEFRFIVADSSDAPLTNGTSSWTPFSDLFEDATNTYRVYGGDQATGYYYGVREVYLLSKA